jgi:hypothetical protein
MEFVRVPETLQHRVVPRWFEELQQRRKNLVQQGIGVPHVEVEWKQVAPEVEFRLVV